MYILCGEIIETTKEAGLATPLPTIAAELGARCLSILTNPLHKMYGKVNKFLNKGPTWVLTKIVSHWIDRILLREPEDDNGHIEEVDWLLELLIRGLKSQRVGLACTKELRGTNGGTGYESLLAGKRFRARPFTILVPSSTCQAAQEDSASGVPSNSGWRKYDPGDPGWDN